MDLAYMAKMPDDEFVFRRKKLLAQLKDNSITIVFPLRKKSVIRIVIILFDKTAIFGI